MLLSFRVSNFLSIRREQEFSFLDGPALSVRPVENNGWAEDIGTLAAIFGANASGKSNVLKALDFMQQVVTRSFSDWAAGGVIPVTPFVLDAPSKDEASLFEAVFQLDGIRYQYGFRLTARQVMGEWLYAYVTRRRQVWFERDVKSPKVWHFGKAFAGPNKLVADLTGPTALFLSAAVACNHRMAMGAGLFFQSHLGAVWPDDKRARTRYTQSLVSNEERWSEVEDLVRLADLGIRTVRVQRGLPGENSDTILFGHSAGRQRDLVFLPIEAESLGTQAWFALIGPILSTLSDGGTLTIDKIDASLHPHLTSEILGIFSDPQRNPRQAQLLFTSHDTTLLGGLIEGRKLTREQVWFTEKKTDGATVLYPLTDFSPRMTENLERGYLQGRYGAIPFLVPRTTGPPCRD